MKKTYIEPQINIVEINATSALMTTSSITMDAENEYGADQALSRDEKTSTTPGSIWDQVW